MYDLNSSRVRAVPDRQGPECSIKGVYSTVSSLLTCESLALRTSSSHRSGSCRRRASFEPSSPLKKAPGMGRHVMSHHSVMLIDYAALDVEGADKSGLDLVANKPGV